MKRVLCAGLVTLMTTCGAVAQQQIEWKQTTNMPKGLNLPKGSSIDILGIQLGDSYAEARAKLEKLLAEAKATKPTGQQKGVAAYESDSGPPPLREIKVQFRIPAPGGDVTASYVGQLVQDRRFPASVTGGISDAVTVRFSAPSSGHQVIGIERVIRYPTPADEPRFSELMARLSERMGGKPQDVGQGRHFRFQYSNGKLIPGGHSATCKPQHQMNSAEGVPTINKTGDCDVVMAIEVDFGMSADHVKRIVFVLADNERTKANVGADFAFFNAYVRDLQTRSRGAQPKL